MTRLLCCGRPTDLAERLRRPTLIKRLSPGPVRTSNTAHSHTDPHLLGPAVNTPPNNKAGQKIQARPSAATVDRNGRDCEEDLAAMSGRYGRPRQRVRRSLERVRPASTSSGVAVRAGQWLLRSRRARRRHGREAE